MAFEFIFFFLMRSLFGFSIPDDDDDTDDIEFRRNWRKIRWPMLIPEPTTTIGWTSMVVVVIVVSATSSPTNSWFSGCGGWLPLKSSVDIFASIIFNACDVCELVNGKFELQINQTRYAKRRKKKTLDKGLNTLNNDIGSKKSNANAKLTD